MLCDFCVGSSNIIWYCIWIDVAKKKTYRINISLLNLYHSKHTQVIMEAGRRDKRPHSFAHSVSTAGSTHSCSLLKALCWDGHQFNSPNSLILPERICFFFEPLTFPPLSLVVAWLMWPRPPHTRWVSQELVSHCPAVTFVPLYLHPKSFPVSKNKIK